MTVWSDNERALRALSSIGFAPVDRFESSGDGDRYTVLTRSCPSSHRETS